MNDLEFYYFIFIQITQQSPTFSGNMIVLSFTSL